MTRKILLIETSGRVGRVALATEQGVVQERTLDETRRHARDLAPAVQALLHDLGWPPRAVDVVFVSLGPGSYTGLRVGITSAKVFAYATGCALVGVETFAALASQCASNLQEGALPATIHVVSDAQQDNVYQQAFRVNAPGQVEATGALRVVAVTEWVLELNRTILMTGPGLTRFLPRVPDDVPRTDVMHWEPWSTSILELGLQRLNRGEQDNVFALEPIYLRPSSAEEKWKAMGR